MARHYNIRSRYTVALKHDHTEGYDRYTYNHQNQAKMCILFTSYWVYSCVREALLRRIGYRVKRLSTRGSNHFYLRSPWKLQNGMRVHMLYEWLAWGVWYFYDIFNAVTTGYLLTRSLKLHEFSYFTVSLNNFQVAQNTRS